MHIFYLKSDFFLLITQHFNSTLNISFCRNNTGRVQVVLKKLMLVLLVPFGTAHWKRNNGAL